MSNRKKIVGFVSFLILIVLFFGIKIYLKEAYANDNAQTWYLDYDYEKDDANHTITLKKYNPVSGSTSTDITIPSTATINDVTYNVLISGGVFEDANDRSNESIQTITFENGIKAVGSLKNLFKGCSGLKNINFGNLDTSAVTDMSYMFYRCQALQSINLSSFKTNNVTDMSYMFFHCLALESLDVTMFNTVNVEKFDYTFSDLRIKYLDLSSFDTRHATSFSGTFNINSLERITIGKYTDFKVKDGNGGSFGRGVWIKEDDNTEHNIVDVVYHTPSSEVAGTYHFLHKLTDPMIPDYSVDYKILTNTWNLDTEHVSLPNKFSLNEENNKIIQVSYDGNSYNAEGQIVLLFKNQVVDGNNDKYDLRVTAQNIQFNGNNNTAEPLTVFNFTSNFEINSNVVETDMDITFEILRNGIVVNDGSFVFSAYDLDGNPNNSDVLPEKIQLKNGFEINTLKKYENTSITPNVFSKLSVSDNNTISGTVIDGRSELSEFSVKASAHNSIFHWRGKKLTTMLMSYYQPNFVVFKKVDKNNNRLAGATFGLYNDKTNQLIERWTTDSETDKTVFLLPGKYRLKEEEAPEHYNNISSDIVFFVDNEGGVYTIVRGGINTTSNTYSIGQNQDGISLITIKNVIKKGKVIVKHWDESVNPNQLLEEATTYEGDVGETYTGSSKHFTGYALSRKPSNETVEIKETDQVLNYYYKKMSAGVVEKHVDEHNNELLIDPIPYSGNVGDSYSTSAKEFEGYDLSRKPSNASGVMTDKLIEVTYYYKKKAKVVVRHIDEEDNHELINPETINGYVGDDVKTQSKTFTGYRLIREPVSKDIELDYENEDIIYYYRRVVHIITKVIGGGGKITGDEEIYKGYDSTKDYIVITPDKDYVIDKLTVNGVEYEITDENGMIMDQFLNVQEDILVEVRFAKVVKTPPSAANTILPIIALMILVLGTGLIVFQKKLFVK